VAKSSGYLSPSWDAIYEAVLRVSLDIKKKRKEFEAIIALARGGWVPGRLLSDFLRVKRTLSLQITSYKDQEKAENIRLLDQDFKTDARSVLLVDDVSDTGGSLMFARDFLEKLGIEEIGSATLYIKPWTSFVPDFFYQSVTDWVVFPWEFAEFMAPNVRRFAELSRSIGLSPSISSLLEELIDHDDDD
jgi:hypoxanthine phosphoribosyltransferase